MKNLNLLAVSALLLFMATFFTPSTATAQTRTEKIELVKESREIDSLSTILLPHISRLANAELRKEAKTRMLAEQSIALRVIRAGVSMNNTQYAQFIAEYKNLALASQQAGGGNNSACSGCTTQLCTDVCACKASKTDNLSKCIADKAPPEGY